MPFRRNSEEQTSLVVILEINFLKFGPYVIPLSFVSGIVADVEDRIDPTLLRGLDESNRNV